MRDYMHQKVVINEQPDKVIVKQYDNLSRLLRVQIFNDGCSGPFVLDDCQAWLYVKSENGDMLGYIEGEITNKQRGIITFPISNGLTATVGCHTGEIYFTNVNDGGVISSKPFDFIVEKSIRNDDAVLADATPSLLDKMTAAVKTIALRIDSLTALKDADAFPAGTLENEIVDARIGTDNKTYGSLGTAVRKQISRLSEQLEDFDERQAVTDWKSGFVYLTASTGQIDLDNPRLPSSNFVSAIIPCGGYDRFIINASGGENSRLWGWLKFNGEVISYAAANADGDGLIIAPPDEAVYLVINDKAQTGSCYRIRSLSAIESRLDQKAGIVKTPMEKLLEMEWALGQIDSEIGKSIDNAVIPGSTNAMAKSYIDVGDYTDVTIVPYTGYKYAVRLFDRNKKLVKSYAKFDSKTVIDNTNGNYRYLWLFGSYSKTGVTLKAQDIKAVSKGFTAYATPISVTEKLSDVTDSMKALSHVTARYFYEAEQNALAKKVLSDADTNTLTLSIITDTHHNRHNTQGQNSEPSFDATRETVIFNNVAEMTNSLAAVHLGDVSYGIADDVAEYWQTQALTNLPVLFTLGNHDLDTAEIINMCMNRAKTLKKYLGVVFTDDCKNWYLDIGAAVILGLDTSKGVADTTLDWIENTVITIGKPLIVLAHKVPRASLNFNQASIPNGTTLEALLNGYSGGVIAYIHGHNHWDSIYRPEGLNYPYISICSGLASQINTSTHSSGEGSPVSYPREIGTDTEYCFDVFNIHLGTGIIKAFRFGAGLDRIYTPS